MKKRTTLASIAMSFLMISVLAGCTTVAPQQQQPPKPPEETIKNGIKKFTEVTSYSYELAANADITDAEIGKIKFDGTMTGAVDIKDPKDPKFTLKIDGSGSDGSQTGSASADIRLGKEAVYFNLMKLDIGEELPEELTTYMSKWWKITLPEGVLDELSVSLPQGGEAEMTPEQKEMKELLDNTQFFSNPTYVGMEDVKGEQSYHYTVVLDKKAFMDFMKKAAEIEGQVVSESEMKDLELALEADIKGNVWVGSTTEVLNKVDLTVTANDGSGSISFSFVVGDVNKPVTLDTPADAEEFPVEEILGPMMMMMGGGDASMMDTSAQQ